MLKRIICEKFKTQPLDFHNGLNVVLGSSNGSNAIGKSTFLLILAFVFGSEDYVKSAKDVFERIGHHTIQFEFDFDGETYYFSRATNRPNTINQCDAKYQVAIKELTVKKYQEMLLEKYKIVLPHTKFKEIVERFTRIYGHGSHNEHRPLLCTHDSGTAPVENLLKLLNKYEDILNLKIAEEEQGYKQNKQPDRPISEIRSEIGELKSEIEGMEKRRDTLAKQNEDANLKALGVDSEKAERLAAVIKELNRLENRKTRLESQLNAVKNNMPENGGSLRNDFSTLSRFFPDAQIKVLADIESFHTKINDFLRSDIEAEIARIQPLIDDTVVDIDNLKKQLEESGIARSISQSILTQYASVTRKIDEAKEKTDTLENLITDINRRKEAEHLLANLRKKHDAVLDEAEQEVNDEMKAINTVITGGNRPAPTLTLKPDRSFSFGTPEDQSEGTAFKNLIVYDLSILELTPLPVLIHDSSIVKRIEDSDFEQILRLYKKSGESGKQVFIAFDKADTYTQETGALLEESTILHLSVGNELFGKSWSRIVKEPKKTVVNTDEIKKNESQ